MLISQKAFQPPRVQCLFHDLDPLAPFRFQLRVALLPNEVEDGLKVVALLFKGVETFQGAFDVGFPSSDFGSLFGIVPKVRLRGFPFQFFQLGSQFRAVKDTSEIPVCDRRFFPCAGECLLTYSDFLHDVSDWHYDRVCFCFKDGRVCERIPINKIPVSITQIQLKTSPNCV